MAIMSSDADKTPAPAPSVVPSPSAEDSPPAEPLDNATPVLYIPGWNEPPPKRNPRIQWFQRHFKKVITPDFGTGEKRISRNGLLPTLLLKTPWYAPVFLALVSRMDSAASHDWVMMALRAMTDGCVWLLRAVWGWSFSGWGVGACYRFGRDALLDAGVDGRDVVVVGGGSGRYVNGRARGRRELTVVLLGAGVEDGAVGLEDGTIGARGRDESSVFLCGIDHWCRRVW